MAQTNANLGKVWIAGNMFTGIGYQGLLTVNTKTYVESPTRSNDGSIPNINDHDTFIVPRCKINFKYISIEDYQRLCEIVSSMNEFSVTYYDKDFGSLVTHKMYCEPQEMHKLFNVSTSVLGVLDYEVSFIGTLNNLPNVSVTYYLNPNNSGSSILSSTNVQWGRVVKIITGEDMETLASEKGYTLPSGTFIEWNTKADGSGLTYQEGVKINVLRDIKLYAQWFNNSGGVIA